MAAATSACSCSGTGCDESRTGRLGGCCASSGTPCETGSVCSETSCIACGGEGGTCCFNAGSASPSCNAGLRCVLTESGDETCQRCGALGGLCCEGMGTVPCAAGGACITQSDGADRCVSSGGLCMGGSAMYAVGINDVNGCASRVIPVSASSFLAAKQCAATMLRAGEVVFAPAEGVEREYEVCVTTDARGRVFTTVSAFGDAEARRCACDGAALGCFVEFGPCS